MLSNNLRTYSRIVRATATHTLHNKINYNFSNANKTNLQAFADYEYVSKIQQLLKENNINEALKYLVNSHLHGKVLDRHIFRQYYQKVQQNQLPISYQEVAYKLYRTHFKPHILILDWMNSLARSNSPTLISLLREDFNMLKLEMPNVQKADEEKQDIKAMSNIKNPVKLATKSQAPTTSMDPRSPQSQTKKVQQQQLKTASSPVPSQYQNISQVSKQHLSEIGHRLLNSLSSLSTTVILHDIEIKYHNVQEHQKIGQLDLDKFITGQSLTTQHQHHHNNQMDNSSNNRHITYTHNNNNDHNNNINNNTSNNYMDDDQVIEQEDNDGQDQYQEIWDRVQRIKIGRIQIKMKGNNEEINTNQQFQQTQVYQKIETLTTQKNINKQNSQIQVKSNEKDNVKDNEKNNEKKP